MKKFICTVHLCAFVGIDSQGLFVFFMILCVYVQCDEREVEVSK